MSKAHGSMVFSSRDGRCEDVGGAESPIPTLQVPPPPGCSGVARIGGFFDNEKSTVAVGDRDRVEDRRRWATGPVKAPRGGTEDLMNVGERGDRRPPDVEGS